MAVNSELEKEDIQTNDANHNADTPTCTYYTHTPTHLHIWLHAGTHTATLAMGREQSSTNTNIRIKIFTIIKFLFVCLLFPPGHFGLQGSSFQKLLRVTQEWFLVGFGEDRSKTLPARLISHPTLPVREREGGGGG